MDLTTFAPKEFKEHLKYLRAKTEFDMARQRKGLESNSCIQHYAFTGNEGCGIDYAVVELYNHLKTSLPDLELDTKDVRGLYDSNDGFESSFNGICDNGKMLCLKHAGDLALRGNISKRSGIEDLCTQMAQRTNCIVVLVDQNTQVQQVINSNEKMKELFTTIFHFDDLTPEAMFLFMTDYATRCNYMFDPDAEPVMKSYLDYAYKTRGKNFKNTLFLQHFFDNEIIPNMLRRVMGKRKKVSGKADLCTILPEDIPTIKQQDTANAIAKLESLVGLDSIKKQILDHTALVKLNMLRAKRGIYNKMPPMHMVFTGNPGTGKTTIAQYLGEIYHSIGVLSSGHVVVTERTKLVSEFIGGTEKNTLDTINSASGGVLFIDEAYNLFVRSDDNRDYGMRVIETLLTYLSSDDTDMIVILAGYTQEMEKMLTANPGMKSRFPYIFNFDDYTPDQLMLIGKQVLKKEHYMLTPEAERKLAKYVINEYDHKDEHFGNGRFITRLITTHIIPSLSRRLLSKPLDEISTEEMSTIQECDIPEVMTNEQKPNDLDETILAESLEHLDQLIGLQNAKQALHDYVAISKLRHQQGTLKISPRGLSWDFIGKTGTGKSTIAEILGKVLQGLGILRRGQTICVNADELMGNDYYIVLERAIKEAKDGLLFLDMDAPTTKNATLNYVRMWTYNKLRELQQTTAIVFAQQQDSEDMIAHNLAVNGIATYSNSVVFNEFTAKELLGILCYLLKKEYQLDINDEAKQKISKYIEAAKRCEQKDSPVNARTMLHLAQTIAHVTQLRLALSGGDELVTLQDVAHFEWSNVKGKIGYV